MGRSVASAGRERQLKCSEAAAKLGVCERTLRRYMKADRIRFHRLPGGHFRIPESAIEEFWSEHDRRHTRQAETRRVAKARRPSPSPRPSAGRRPRLGCEPPDEYDLSPAALERLRAQFALAGPPSIFRDGVST